MEYYFPNSQSIYQKILGLSGVEAKERLAALATNNVRLGSTDNRSVHDAVEDALATLQSRQRLDVQNGTNTIIAVVLALFGAIALGIAAWQGLEAMQNHRAIMPAFISLVIGLGLIFGGAYYLQKFGVL